MSIYLPLIKRTSFSGEMHVERALPIEGLLNVQVGDNVVPYDHLGECNYSHKVYKLPKGFRPKDFKKETKFYYMGSDLGKFGKQKITAPFNGNLTKNDDGSFDFDEEESKYLLLSGVWGTILKVIDKKSVLIKTQMKNIHLSVSTNHSFSGELIVFPNPSAVLEKHYIGAYSVEAADSKIVYVGNHVSQPLLMEAKTSGWGGVLAGSADKEAFDYAKMHSIVLGIFGGYGEIETPKEAYDLLTEVSNRYVFFEGANKLLRIPIPVEEYKSTQIKKPNPLKYAKKGIQVVVLQDPHFGQTGVVDSISENSILVKFPNEENPVEVKLPNLLAVE